MSLGRDALIRLLGLRPPRNVRYEAGLATDTGPFITQELTIDHGDGPIPATFLRPQTSRPHPAVLYCHAHGNDWTIGRREVTEGRPALPCGPYGPALVEAGFAVLCLDMPGHGDRAPEGSEAALATSALWQGQTLMGRMLADLIAGLDVLSRQATVDPNRIGALGLSMGATHAYWLAALDNRVQAVAHLCVLADMAPLIATGAHDLHGIYMTVPGLLHQGDMGDVAALIAPRPQFVGLGDADPLTPPAAADPALARLRRAYETAGAADDLIVEIEPGSGHIETRRHRAAVLRFFATALR